MNRKTRKRLKLQDKYFTRILFDVGRSPRLFERIASRQRVCPWLGTKYVPWLGAVAWHAWIDSHYGTDSVETEDWRMIDTYRRLLGFMS